MRLVGVLLHLLAGFVVGVAMLGGADVSASAFRPGDAAVRAYSAQARVIAAVGEKPGGFTYDGLIRAYDDGAGSRRTVLGRTAGGAAGLPLAATRSSPTLDGFVAAEDAAVVVAKNGETAATAAGRAMRKAWDYGPGFEKEFRLPSGLRVDALNATTREILELKPNNPRAIALGERRIERYLAELNSGLPEGATPWTGRVVTYP